MQANGLTYRTPRHAPRDGSRSCSETYRVRSGPAAERGVTVTTHEYQTLLAGAELPASIFDALTAHLCVLDPRGRVVAVNRAWRRFAGENPPMPLDAGLGADYYGVCERAEGAEAGTARQALAGLQAVASGRTQEFALEYACHTPAQQRWFEMRVTPLVWQGQRHLVVAHWDITGRKLAESALRESQERYRAVVEDQTEVICRFKPDGTLTFVNEVFCRYMGRTVSEWVGTRWQPQAFPADVAHVEAQLRRLSPETPVVTVENRGFNAAGDVRWLQFVNRGFFAAEGTLLEVQAVGRDVTERKTAELALRQSQERMALVLETARIGVWEWDLETGAVFWSLETLEIVGHAAFDGTLESFVRLVHPEDRDRVLQAARRAVDGRRDYTAEFRVLRPDGCVRWLQNLGRVQCGEEGRAVRLVGSVVDITDRKQAEEERRRHAAQLRALSRSRLEAQEAERRRLAHELHDEIGQRLTVLKIQLDSLCAAVPVPVAGAVQDGSRQVGQLIDAVRNLSLELRPSMLDDLGLAPALLWLFDRLKERTGLQVDLDQEGLEAGLLSSQIQIALYRVVQEAMTNVIRHAGTSQAVVHIRIRTATLWLEVEDRGRGFDVDALVTGTRSVGIAGMRERLADLGGELTLQSVPGVGTWVQVWLPLSSPATSEPASL